VRQYGARSIQVARRLRAMLENLSSVLPRERSEVLLKQLQLLHSGVERNFDDLEDRLMAETSDVQGVGGSPNAKSRTQRQDATLITSDQDPVASR
jgi:uncharacterized membrane protein